MKHRTSILLVAMLMFMGIGGWLTQAEAARSWSKAGGFLSKAGQYRLEVHQRTDVWITYKAALKHVRRN